MRLTGNSNFAHRRPSPMILSTKKDQKSSDLKKLLIHRLDRDNCEIPLTRKKKVEILQVHCTKVFNSFKGDIEYKYINVNRVKGIKLKFFERMYEHRDI